MLVVYTLDSAINDFFEAHPNVTRYECDELAASLVGQPVDPVPIQGSFSYTVTAGAGPSKIVHFRSPTSVLDTATLDLAAKIHGTLVPSFTYRGHIGQHPYRLSVYVMDKIPGDVYIQTQLRYQGTTDSSLDASPQHVNTVADLARFFAQSWNNAQTNTADAVQGLQTKYCQQLLVLSDGLPSRFSSKLQNVIDGLPRLFAASYPLVLTHRDLNELNFLTNPSTGHITGIIDWAEASILPFGMTLWSLDNMLGVMNSAGWHYHGNHQALKDHFWQIFQKDAIGVSSAEMQCIQVARMAGIFIRFGLRNSTAGEGWVLKDPESSSFRYLEAFCCSDL